MARQQADSAKIVSQYIENEDTRCGARMGCVQGRLRALTTIKVAKDGHTLTGDPAAIADLKSIVGAGSSGSAGSDPSSGYQSHQCNWNPLTWGGCAKNAVHWVGQHPLETALIVAAIASCVVGCAAAAGALAVGAGTLGGTAIALTTACTAVCAPTLAAGGTALMATLYGSPDVPSAPEVAAGDAAAADSGDASAAASTADAPSIEAVATTVMDSSAGAIDISAKTLEEIDGDLSEAAPATAADPVTPTEPKTTDGSDVGSTKPEPATAVNRAPSGSTESGSADGSAAGPDAEPTAPTTAGCAAPHSFTGTTPVLMADGTTKPIDQVKPGDKVTNAQPDGKNETHAVDKVIVTTTDHDFAALTITPIQPRPSAPSTPLPAVSNGLDSRTRTKIAAAAVAAALVLIPSATPAAGTSAPPANNLTTTYHHAFYDATTNRWTEAENLRPGDLLQTPTGYAVLDAIHLYHADTTTYDLTIDGLHTYYVVAGSTPVLVHNCDDDVTGVRNAPMNYNPVTKGQISQQAAYDYQRSVTGLYEFEVSGGGTKVWADGIDGTELVDTKYITNPASSPYTGTAPDFINQSTIDEIQRYGKVIADPQTRFTSLRIVTNDQAGVDYFSNMLDQFGIPGQVKYRP